MVRECSIWHTLGTFDTLAVFSQALGLERIARQSSETYHVLLLIITR
jgi:hypothetical protein